MKCLLLPTPECFLFDFKGLLFEFKGFVLVYGVKIELKKDMKRNVILTKNTLFHVQCSTIGTYASLEKASFFGTACIMLY